MILTSFHRVGQIGGDKERLEDSNLAWVLSQSKSFVRTQ